MTLKRLGVDVGYCPDYYRSDSKYFIALNLPGIMGCCWLD